MRRVPSCIAAVFVATLVVAPASAAGMAPSYVSSEPSDGEELHRAPDRVEVTFSEPLDESSELAVEDSCGRTVDDGKVTIEANRMTVGIALKPSGRYQVSYAATGLAGLTGTNNGDFKFKVHLGRACEGGGGNAGRGGKNTGGGGGGQKQQEGQPGSGYGSATGGGGIASGGYLGSVGGQARSEVDGKRPNPKDRGKGDGKERGGGKQGRQGGAPETSEDAAEPGPLAAGEGQPPAPDGQAVMLALGFSLALGAVGGWFLRVSGR